VPGVADLPTVIQAIIRRLDLVPGEVLLVAPCADGRLAIALAKALPRGVRVLGVDADPCAINRARSATHALRPEISRDLAWRLASPQAITVASGSCGGAVIDATRLPDADHDGTITDVARTVFPGGWVVIVVDDTDLINGAAVRASLVRCNLRECAIGDGLAWGRKAL
jgi:SAM-dependent methyltransferase